jgi:hypothetical protein
MHDETDHENTHLLNKNGAIEELEQDIQKEVNSVN